MKRFYLLFSLYLLTIWATSDTPSSADPRKTADAPPPLEFHHLTPEDGLSYSYVYNILQDRRGFIWLATKYGLNRYDGMEFKVYTHDPDDPDSLSDNFVWSLHEDRDGFIWITTWGGGLNRFDPAAETFTRYRHDPDDPNSLGSDYLWWFFEDSAGNRWIGGEAGLDRFDPRTGTFVHYSHNPDDPDSLSHDSATMITEDGAGFLWISTFGGGLNRFDPRSETFRHYRHEPNAETSLSDDKVYCVLVDRRNRIWVGTQRGLNRLDLPPDQGLPETDGFIRYRNNPDAPDSLSHDRVRALYRDASGTLWVGTTGGLNRYRPETDAFARYAADDDNPGALLNNSIYFIQGDAAGDLWVGHAGGVSKTEQGRRRFDLYARGADVQSVYEDADGTLWIGTGKSGLKRIHRHGETAMDAGNAPGKPLNLGGHTVKKILPAHDGDLWIATLDGGLNRCRPAAGTCRRYRNDPDDPRGLSSNAILDIASAPDGGLWIATLNSGLNRFDPDRETFTHFTHDPDDPDSLVSNWCRTLRVDSGGNVWIGTEAGLSRFDPERRAFTHYRAGRDSRPGLSDNVVNMIHEDGDGILWIATNDGLNRLDPETGHIVAYRTAHGLPGNSISAILEDDHGNLWLSTNNGLSRFDPTRTTFRNYDRLDGLQGRQFIYHAAFKSPDGELFFGGTNGLNAFHPDQLTDNPHVPPVHLTDFRLFNRSVPIGGDSPLERSILFTDHIALSHRQSVFSFEFAALNYRASEKNRYAYRMDGFDKNWTVVDSRNRSAKYTNLDPGDYVFQVKGANNDGLWNEKGTSIAVAILPPWWETAPFRIAMLALFAGLMFGGYRWRVGAVERRNRVLEEQVGERTLALERQKEALRKNEEKFRGLVEGVNEVIYRMSLPDGRYEYVSPAAETVFGYPPAALYDNPLFIQNIVHPDSAAYFHEQWTDLMAGRLPPTYEYKVTGPEGDDRWILQSNNGIFDDKGNLVAIEGLCRNITAFKQSQAELRAAKDAAESANRAKDVFLARMSHDLRTPLNAILGYSRILGEEDGVGDERKESLRIIHESGQLLLSLVDDILDISKIAAGKTELHSWTIRLGPFLDNIVAIIRTRASEKRIDLVYEADPDLPEYIVADGKRLGQVLLNLLGNAVKFTDAGRTVFRVKSDPGAPPGAAKLCFEVEDTGPGIPPDRMKAIFLPFEQAGDPGRRTEGSGLGLAISRQLVRLMGGDIEVESEPGEGSLFRFRSVFTLETDAPAQDPAPRGVLIGYRGERRRLLVIDDKEANRLMLRDMLAPLGFEVLLAHDGAEGLRQASQSPPHLVLMDLVMPEMSGFEAARALRDIPGLAQIPIVAVSAGFTDMTPEGAVEKGFDAYLSKPVDADALHEQLQDLLDLEWVRREDTADEGVAPDFPVETLSSKNPPPIPPAQRRHAVSLIRQRLLPLWETLIDSYYIDDIKTFAAEIKAVAAALDVADLKAYAEHLETAAARHQVDEIDALLRRFKAIYDDLRATADDAADGVIDWDALRKGMGGDSEMVAVFLRICLKDDDTPKLLEKLKTAVGADDLKTIATCAHTLQGIAVNIKARAFAETCRRLEDAAETAETDRLPELIATVETEYDRVKSAITDALPEPHPPPDA